MERIGIRLPNPIGDVVAATPLIRLLKQRNPEDRIVLIGSAKAIELLDGLDTWHEAEALEETPHHGKLSAWEEGTFLKNSYLTKFTSFPILSLPPSQPCAQVFPNVSDEKHWLVISS